MKRFRSIKWLFLLQAAIALLLVLVSLATSMRILQFHYPRVIENDPLLAPVGVRSILGNTLCLEDGRAIEMNCDEPLEQLIARSGFRVDLEPAGDDPSLLVYVKTRGFLCGTPWTGLIQFPLFADEVPMNHRELIGFGHLKPTSNQRCLK